MTKVLVKFRTRSLGDTIGAMPAVEAFQKRESCIVYVDCGWQDILQKSYPSLFFTKFEESAPVVEKTIEVDYHFEHPLQEGFARDLGFENWSYRRPRIDEFPGERPVKPRYVVIGVHTTAQCKYWNYPNGWDNLCRLLRKEGLTPVCVDQHAVFGIEGSWNEVPKSSAVRRLNNTIQETMNYIKHAEFFLGVSSGLAWVAHAMQKKVVMISGVTEPWNEFEEDCVRIIDRSVCNGCFHKPNELPFDSGNWNWCPLHAGTPRQFECTKAITPNRVLEEIRSAGWL
jgi:autotransporter strand-loop-strand O-heptosyltransferase